MSHLHHKVSALVDGELQGSALTRALAHLRCCPACRREVEQTLALKHRLSGLSGAEPTLDLFVRLGALRVADSPTPVRRRFAAGRRVLVGAGSVSMAVLSLAYVVGGTEPAAMATLTPPVDEFAAEFAERTGDAPLSDPVVEGFNAGPVSYSGASADSSLSADHAAPAAIRTFTGEAAQPRGDVVLGRSSSQAEAQAVARLERAVQAPERISFSGQRRIEMVSGGVPTTVQVGVEHVPGQGTSFDVSGVADQEAAMFVTQDEPSTASALAGGRLHLLVTAYDLSVTGAAAVAGRPVSVVSAHRDDVLVARFFLDDATGLLMRREMYDGGALVRISSFVSLRTSRSGFLSHLPPELGAATTTSATTQSAQLLDDDGYACPRALVGGFMMTALQQVDSASGAIHAAYSDGLSSVSVFEQRGSLDSRSMTGFREVDVGGDSVSVRQGLPMVVVWESAGTVFTVVTDAPSTTATRLVADMPHDLPLVDDTPPRLVGGLERFASYVTPR